MFSASGRVKEMPSCSETACLFTQHKPAQDLHTQTDASHMTGAANSPSTGCLCVSFHLCVASVQHNESETAPPSCLIKLGGMGAERWSGWWSGETSSRGETQLTETGMSRINTDGVNLN